MIHYIDKLLLNWADWRIRGKDGGRGYPNKAIYCQMVHIRSDQDGFALPIEDEQAYEIDGIVGKMSKEKPELWRVVDWYYCTGVPMERMLEECGYASKDTFYKKLHQAHCYVQELMEENTLGEI